MLNFSQDPHMWTGQLEFQVGQDTGGQSWNAEKGSDAKDIKQTI